MDKSLKIVVIGGGSSYTPEIVEGFILNYDKLPIREIWLVDIPQGEWKLNIVGSLAKRMVEKSGLPIQVHLTLDRREALPGQTSSPRKCVSACWKPAPGMSPSR